MCVGLSGRELTGLAPCLLLGQVPAASQPATAAGEVAIGFGRPPHCYSHTPPPPPGSPPWLIQPCACMLSEGDYFKSAYFHLSWVQVNLLAGHSEPETDWCGAEEAS